VCLKRCQEKWGDFGDVEKMKDHLKQAELDLELIEREEPVDFSDDPDGRMFTLAFKKTGASQQKSLQWLIQKAEDFKQAGNRALSSEGLMMFPTCPNHVATPGFTREA